GTLQPSRITGASAASAGALYPAATTIAKPMCNCFIAAPFAHMDDRPLVNFYSQAVTRTSDAIRRDARQWKDGRKSSDGQKCSCPLKDGERRTSNGNGNAITKSDLVLLRHSRFRVRQGHTTCVPRTLSRRNRGVR